MKIIVKRHKGTVELGTDGKPRIALGEVINPEGPFEEIPVPETDTDNIPKVAQAIGVFNQKKLRITLSFNTTIGASCEVDQQILVQ